MKQRLNLRLFFVLMSGLISLVVVFLSSCAFQYSMPVDNPFKRPSYQHIAYKLKPEKVVLHLGEEKNFKVDDKENVYKFSLFKSYIENGREYRNCDEAIEEVTNLKRIGTNSVNLTVTRFPQRCTDPDGSFRFLLIAGTKINEGRSYETVSRLTLVR